MKYKTFVVVSDDKITSKLFKDFNRTDVLLLKDRSSNFKRFLKLVVNRRIPIKAFFLMALAEFLRKKTDSTANFEVIRSNHELQNLYRKHVPEKIVLFRAGLIVKRNLFPLNLQMYNLHCAKLPEYGGLASIYRARLAGDLKQNATLHVLTDEIDGGAVLDEQPYTLSQNESYRTCEDLAYQKGYELLCKTL
jgi:methionyl-tRNA formyltransferase